MSELARHIEVDGGYNIRDLGGYPTADGRTTRWRTLVRSGNLDQVTPDGQQTLLRLGVRTVIDLRDDEEVEQYPDVFAQSSRVKYLHRTLAPAGFANTITYARLEGLYFQYLSVFHANIGAAISAIAEGEPGILYHCAAGKDRTGVVTALLLGLVGVPADVIAEDYALTRERITHLVAQWREFALQNGQSLLDFERDVSAEAQTMLATLSVLDSEYGGAVGYLRACGVMDAQLARLKTLLVAS